MAALKLRGLHKRFGETIALDGVDLDVYDGEVLAIVGENGAGKSTLLNMIAGLHRPVAYIRQELSLFPHLSVAENVLIGIEPSRFGFIERNRMIERTRVMLAGFGRSEISPQALVRDLPPASRQVVEICRALAVDARLILMDEPTSSLQRSDVERLFEAIRTLCRQGISVIYVSHFLEEVREIAQRIVVLRDGRNVWSGQPDETSDDELVTHMVGRSITHDATVRKSPTTFGDVILEASVQADPAVHHANLKLHRGEVLGIAGLVGSGRTELIKSLYGLLPITRGVMSIAGAAIMRARQSPAHSIRCGLGYLSEDRVFEGMIPHLSVRDNITITRPQHRDAAHWIKSLNIRSRDQFSSIRTLSGGNQQKVLLARLLHQKADVLLLDEPTRGIDVGSKAEIYKLIRELAAQGKAILMVSSYLPELFGVCDSLAVMSRGRLSETRPIGEWTPDSILHIAIGR